MRYLLDTKVWIIYLKAVETAVRGRLEQTSPDDIATCSVVWAELLHGARKYADPVQRERRIELTLSPLTNLPFDLAAARSHARIRDYLERAGQVIGGNDLMIASIALAHGLTLVTHNSKEFNRVPGLQVEDWSV
ncbi:MAG: type II toxin-antitoxin system VapC family toxin [Acidobacteriota bacterium]